MKNKKRITELEKEIKELKKLDEMKTIQIAVLYNVLFVIHGDSFSTAKELVKENMLTKSDPDKLSSVQIACLVHPNFM